VPLALWGFSHGLVVQGWIRAPAAIALPRRMGVGDGLNERQGALLDRVGGATAGRFIDLEKAEAVLAESQRRR